MADVDTTRSGWLVGYQTAWLADAARFKVALKARRIGFSEVAALEIAARASGIDLVSRTTAPPVPQVIVSASEGQAKKLLARAARHLTAFRAAGADLLDGEPGKSEIRLRNGVTITAFSSNAATIRGEAGDVTIDEYGAMSDPDGVWAAVQPIANATLGNPHGYRIRVIGTPLGDDNRFYRICRGDLAKTWSVHEVSIHDAVRAGFPADVAALREEIGDDDLFAQEYELSFLSADARYISAAIYDGAVCDDPPTDDRIEARYGGLDLARHAHKSVLVQLARYQHFAPLHVHDVDARRDQSWDAQETWIDDAMSHLRALAVDSTGLGSQFAERLVARHGSAVLPIEFTLASKERLATGLRLALERKLLRVTRHHAELRRAVLSIRRKITPHGNTVFQAPVQKGSHSDEAWALMLAVEAAGGAAAERSRVPQVTSRSTVYADQLGSYTGQLDRGTAIRSGKLGPAPVRVDIGLGRRGAWRGGHGSRRTGY
jgi:phage FluMu gp28-like protein